MWLLRLVAYYIEVVDHFTPAILTIRLEREYARHLFPWLNIGKMSLIHLLNWESLFTELITLSPRGTGGDDILVPARDIMFTD
jgi:hypothetical protein